MIDYDIFPVDDSGVTPHIDPRTQTIEQITENGVLCWKVTNYTLQELQGVGQNTDTEWYVTHYTAQINRITNNIIALRADTGYYDKLTADQKIQIDIYQTQISAIPTTAEFPIGVVFPQVPTVVAAYRPGPQRPQRK
jgi:hypothetical protein